MTNPLLAHQELPKFSLISPEHVEPAIDHVLAANRAEIIRLLDQVANPIGDVGDAPAPTPPNLAICGTHPHPRPPTWNDLLVPLEILENALRRTWSPISHLNGVLDSQALRTAYSACLPKLSLYYAEMGQNTRLYQAYQAIATSTNTLAVAQRKVLENALRDFRLAGVDLPPLSQQRFKDITIRLSQLANTFSENILDATQAWSKLIEGETGPHDLMGLPDFALDLLRQNARERNQEGGRGCGCVPHTHDGWLLTLAFPAYLPVITYAQNRALRQEIYTAYVTRASDLGPHAGRWDNTPLMEEILALRHEMAQLLGFTDFAALSLVTKMAKSAATVMAFLHDLAKRSRPQALREFAEVTAFAQTVDGITCLEAWDVAYYSERLRQARYAISQDELRPYFPAPKVIAGLFAIASRLFDLVIEEVTHLETWHVDVTCYQVKTTAGTIRGYFYLDPYARAQKRSGAWMDGASDRMINNYHTQLPVAYLVCNFTPPVNDNPSLLSHEEVRTLFHEFGHGLQHLLTTVDQPAVAGINGVAWDAVELPSQFMENWCWERAALDLFASHWMTGAPMPEELYARMYKAKNFQSAMQMVRQLELALFDLRLHCEYDPTQGARVLELLAAVRAEVAVFPYPTFNRLAHTFSHIFGGGYAAGYYSYKWAEVLSADAFALFEERGLFDAPTGQAFKRYILEPGGSVDANELFIAFRGRKPTLEPLLRHSGIAT